MRRPLRPPRPPFQRPHANAELGDLGREALGALQIAEALVQLIGLRGHVREALFALRQVVSRARDTATSARGGELGLPLRQALADNRAWIAEFDDSGNGP